MPTSHAPDMHSGPDVQAQPPGLPLGCEQGSGIHCNGIPEQLLDMQSDGIVQAHPFSFGVGPQFGPHCHNTGSQLLLLHSEPIAQLQPLGRIVGIVHGSGPQWLVPMSQ